MKQLWYRWRSLRSQTFHVTYAVKLHNTSLQARNYLSILPCPRQTPYQQIVVEPVASDPTAQLLYDEVEHNPYYVWRGDIYPGGSWRWQLSTTVTVQPRLVEVRASQFSLADYHYSEKIKTYLQPDTYIESRLPEIKQWAERVKSTEDNVVLLAQKLQTQVLERLHYGNPQPALYRTSQALQGSPVDCGGYDTVLAALLQACGIPCRIIGGFWAGYGSNQMHAWLEFLLPDGSWVPLDPSISQLRQLGRTHKFGNFGRIGSDRIVIGYGCDLALSVLPGHQSRVSLLQTPLSLIDGSRVQYETNYDFLC